MTTPTTGLPLGLLVLDRDGTVRYADPAVVALLCGPDELPPGQVLWTAAPALAGTGLAAVAERAPGTWRGRLPGGGGPVAVEVVPVGERLHLVVRRDTGHEDAGDQAGAADLERLRFLVEAGEALNGTLDTDEAARVLAELVVPRLCDWAVVTVVDDDGHRDRASAHRDPARRADVATYLARRTWGAGDEGSPLLPAILSGRPVQIAPIEEDLLAPSLTSPEAREAWRRLDAGSCTFVPLRTRAEMIGALSLLNGRDRPPLTPAEVETASEIARRASLALDNARLYGRQLKVAETLQRSMLTAPPRLDGLEVAARYLPAGADLHVGGDWYDAFAAADGTPLLVMGDVVGHNVDAAAAMGQLRSLVRGVAYDRRVTPARILSRVDDLLAGLGIGTLATAVVAELDGAAGGPRTLRWSSAGHLPPLLAAADGTVRALATPPEILLGARAGQPRTDHEAAVGPGDTVVLYTDGLVEHARTDIDTGLARLTAVLASCAGRPVEEVCDLLLAGIVRRRPDDDIALTVVRLG